MGIPIDSSLIDDLDNPSQDVLNYAIRAHRRAIRRLDKLAAYYKGEQDIFKRSHSTDRVSHSSIMVNHAKYVTDMVVGFTTGNPISITPAKDKDIQPLMDVLDLMDITSHDAELEKDLSVFGEAYELLYLDMAEDGVTTEEKVTKIDPRSCVLVTDDTVDNTPLFGIHYQPKYTLTGGRDGYLITVYTQHNVIRYRTAGAYVDLDTLREPEDTTPHYFGDVPLIEYRNNEERQGDFEQATTLIDAYNNLTSDRLSDKANFVDALLVFYGFKVEDTIEKNGVIEAPGKGEDGASVEWLTKSFDESQIQVLSQALADDIHKITAVPNMNDKNFMGNVSGEAMKYKLFGLLQLLATKQRYLSKGIQQRLKLLANIINIKGQHVDAAGATITIVPNIPVNMADIIGNIKNAEGIIPQQIALGWLPGTNSPDELIAMLNAEKQEAMDRQASMIALNAEGGVQSNLDDDDDEGGDNDDPRKVPGKPDPGK